VIILIVRLIGQLVLLAELEEFGTVAVIGRGVLRNTLLFRLRLCLRLLYLLRLRHIGKSLLLLIVLKSLLLLIILKAFQLIIVILKALLLLILLLKSLYTYHRGPGIVECY